MLEGLLIENRSLAQDGDPWIDGLQRPVRRISLVNYQRIRDAGVLETAKGTILVTTFTSLAFETQLAAPTPKPLLKDIKGLGSVRWLNHSTGPKLVYIAPSAESDNREAALDEDDAAPLGDVGEVAVAPEGARAVDVARHARTGGDRVDALGVDQVALALFEHFVGLESEHATTMQSNVSDHNPMAVRLRLREEPMKLSAPR